MTLEHPAARYPQQHQGLYTHSTAGRHNQLAVTAASRRIRVVPQLCMQPEPAIEHTPMSILAHGFATVCYSYIITQPDGSRKLLHALHEVEISVTGTFELELPSLALHRVLISVEGYLGLQEVDLQRVVDIPAGISTLYVNFSSIPFAIIPAQATATPHLAAAGALPS